MSSATARLPISAPLSRPPPQLPLPFFHIPVGVCPFPSHALMQGLLCLWYSWWRGCCSSAPVTVPTPVPSHSHAGAPALHTPSMAAGSAPLLCALSWVPLPSAPSQQPPCHQDITSEEKGGGGLTFPALAASQELGPTRHRVLAGDEGCSLP